MTPNEIEADRIAKRASEVVAHIYRQADRDASAVINHALHQTRQLATGPVEPTLADAGCGP